MLAHRWEATSIMCVWVLGFPARWAGLGKCLGRWPGEHLAVRHWAGEKHGPIGGHKACRGRNFSLTPSREHEDRNHPRKNLKNVIPKLAICFRKKAGSVAAKGVGISGDHHVESVLKRH